ADTIVDTPAEEASLPIDPEPATERVALPAVAQGEAGTGVGTGSGSGIGDGQGTGIGSSSGSGIDAGSGTGIGSGSGSGIGAGSGSGTGSGSGSGIGSGSGSGRGTGSGSGNLQAPSILQQLKPRYPEQARQNGIEGTVDLRIQILTSGRPGTISVKKSSGDASLDAAAVESVRKWRFVPAKDSVSGRPVECYVTRSVVFQITNR
ncbi:MAG: energy transducer TonB, partial [Sporomusaceae bacterium]|nr:energy transducer TonB [Sporomusaceae bacterium]